VGNQLLIFGEKVPRKKNFPFHFYQCNCWSHGSWALHLCLSILPVLHLIAGATTPGLHLSPFPSLQNSIYRIKSLLAGAIAPCVYLPPSASLQYSNFRILSAIAVATARRLHLLLSPSLQHSNYKILSPVAVATTPGLHFPPSPSLQHSNSFSISPVTNYGILSAIALATALGLHLPPSTTYIPPVCTPILPFNLLAILTIYPFFPKELWYSILSTLSYFLFPIISSSPPSFAKYLEF